MSAPQLNTASAISPFRELRLAARALEQKNDYLRVETISSLLLRADGSARCSLVWIMRQSGWPRTNWHRSMAYPNFAGRRRKKCVQTGNSVATSASGWKRERCKLL